MALRMLARFAFLLILNFINYLSLTGCMKDVAVPNVTSLSSVVQYEGFTGLESVTTQSPSKVKLAWNRSTSSNVVGYNIYDVTLRSSPKLIKTVAATASDVTITGLTPANLYWFRVKAVDNKDVEDGNTKDVGGIPYGGVLTAEVRDSTSAVINFSDASNADTAFVFCSTLLDPIEKEMLEIPDVSLNQATLTGLVAGEQYSCRVALSISGVVDNNSKQVSFIPMGTASQLVFSTQPTSSNAGVNFPNQPVVVIKDVNGTVVASGPDSSAMVSLTISTNSPTLGTLRGTASVAAVKGIATFSGLNIQESGIKIIAATKADTSSLTNGSPSISVDSSQFTITAGVVDLAQSSISILPQPSTRADGLVANGSSSYTVSIHLADQYGNPITGVKPTFASSLVGDTLSQPTVSTDSSGKATGSISSTFADTQTPYRTIWVSSPTGLSSKKIEVPFVPGAPTKLVFVTQPVNSPAGNLGMSVVKVAVQDAQGNTVTTGPAATSTISMAIASNLNGATLSGTLSATAVDGVATFSDLGIDKTQTGYKLLASSGTFTPAYSNSFNITAGTPQKIFIGGPANVLSGSCSTAFTIQLRDLGNNPSNAIFNTPVILSGLGGSSMYSSSACTGSALSTTMTFTPGTNTKTVYLKNVKAENLNILASDSSAVLTQGNLNVKFNPNKMSLLAQSTLGGPLSVAAGACSTAIVVTPAGDNGVAGPILNATTVSFTGLGSNAQLFSDSNCTVSVDPLNATLPVSVGGAYTTSFYLKDPKAEVLSLSVVDPTAVITTTSGPQTVSVLASKIIFSGPSSVVAGLCSSAFTVTLKDEQNNSVVAPAATPLTVNGLSGSVSGQFYTSPSCAGGGSNSSITVPINYSSIQIYLKDSHAETLSLSLSDPAGIMASSSALSVGISPSALEIIGSVSTSKTSECVGPFTLRTLDGNSQVTAAITPITANLGGAGTAGSYYSESTCDSLNKVTSFVFSAGQSTKDFYFKGQYPSASLTFTATDAAAILSAASYNFSVTSSPGWIGTSGTQKEDDGSLSWFKTGIFPVASRTDGVRSAYYLHFDSTKQYLYVSDPSGHRVVKYDYLNRTYIGWIGRLNGDGQIGITGSNLTTPSTAACVSTAGWAQTPGWCVGGASSGASTNSTSGFMYTPVGLADDGAYLYVVQQGTGAITRYDAVTGAFAGWIGRIASTPTGAATGGPASCTNPLNTVTPGWCVGGDDVTDASTSVGLGDGSMYLARAIAYYNGSIFVSRYGSILKFNSSDGSFQGWIGRVNTTPTGGAVGCDTAPVNSITPGWCTGGTSVTANPKTTPGSINSPTGLYILGSTLYVVHTDSGGVVSQYDANTGAFLGLLPNLAYNWAGPYQMTSDGSNFYFADSNRIIKTDPNGLVLGWVGKVSNNNSMSGNPGCSTLVPNATTPGWCLGGTSKSGMEDGALHNNTAIAYDGAGHLITGQGLYFPSLKMWNASTGEFEGTLSYRSTSPKEWSRDNTQFAQLFGFDDYSMNSPQQGYVYSGYLYQPEIGSSRIKKIKLETGEVVGWIGGIATTPTGGDPGCTSATPLAASPGWCLGSWYNPEYIWNTIISQTVDGIMRYPVSVTGDGTYLYVVDASLHRIQKFNLATGVYVGWVGQIGTSPLGGAPGCAGATVGSFTPGWCTGGYPQAGTGDGALNQPVSLTYASGNLYVLDQINNRVSSYNATTGAYNGWIGRIGTNPSSGCTYGTNGSYNVSQSGWCKGGTSTVSALGDKGGGFYFYDLPSTRTTRGGGITTDGTYLYITNQYNIRIDKYTLAGVYQGSVNSRFDGGLSAYTQTWTTNTTTLASWVASGCSYPMSLWTDGSNIYGGGRYSCSSGNGPAVWKMNLSTGTMIGWQGAIYSSAAPTAGDAGCPGATNTTPGWCQNGGTTSGYRMGQYSGILGVTGDSHFIYVSDDNSHRVTRIPK